MTNPTSHMRVLYRFTKPGGHWAEIRERKVTLRRALEFSVFVDGSLIKSEMFQDQRVWEYPTALQATVAEFIDGGWTEDPEPNQGLS